MEGDESSTSDRRKYHRLEDNIFILGHSRSSPTEEFKAFAENISAGGLVFKTERDIPKDTKLDLEIYQPRDGRKSTIFSLHVLARVVWKREIEKDNFEDGENRYIVGIEFSEIKEEDRQKIIKYVEENKS